MCLTCLVVQGYFEIFSQAQIILKCSWPTTCAKCGWFARAGFEKTLKYCSFRSNYHSLNVIFPSPYYFKLLGNLQSGPTVINGSESNLKLKVN